MIVTLDYETTYDQKEYSLSKMSEVEYLLDPRYETIMCAVKLGSRPTRVFVGHDRIKQALDLIPWDRVALLAHNTRFDGAILAWKYGHIPKLYLDTLSMARATTHWSLGRSSLGKVSEYLGLPPKGDEVIRASGKKLCDFAPDELAAYQAYCARDNDNCHAIFEILRSRFSATELSLIDIVIRMFILPQVKLDTQTLQRHLDEVQAEKARIMAEVEANVDKSVFSSNIKFADLLASYGVEIPMKTSPTTGREIPALAKGDWLFKELCVDESQPIQVQALLAARMSSKSTLEETRTRNLLALSQLHWPNQGDGWATVPLKYSGARTHRLSGDGGTNWQNFRRGSTIRRAIYAPDGYRIVHRDASQIEARMVAWLSKCQPLLSAFSEGRDVYSEFASQVYDRPVTRADIKERFVGKTAILGLGYGCGAAKFRHMLFIGNGGDSYKIELEEATRIVRSYRTTYIEVTELWNSMTLVIEQIIHTQDLMGIVHRATLGGLAASLPVKADNQSILLPNGMKMVYPNIRHYRSGEKIEVCYDDPYGITQKLYGAKCLENVSQALARIIVTDIAVSMKHVTGWVPFLSTHDSLDYCVPEGLARDVDYHLSYLFEQTPGWAAGLPLASEGGWGVTLADAEKGVNQ